MASFAELTQYGDAREELVVHAPLADGGAHEDAAVGVAVEPPQLERRARAHGGGARRAVDQRQLAETAALAYRRHHLAVHQHLHPLTLSIYERFRHF